QFLGQLSASARETVFGNVGSMITFRIGADDAAYLAQEFAPRFTGHDIMNLDVRALYVKMSIGGSTPPAFSASTVRVDTPQKTDEEFQKLVEMSRASYATPIDRVMAEFETLYEVKKDDQGKEVAVAAAEEEDFDTPIV
ncbi:MAG: hypothetical protein AAB855_04405, partial [Patescibacteria group bacterium]